jgi:hypothetical protein
VFVAADLYFSPSFCHQVGATEITQTLLAPVFDVSSVSILGVGSDGMTTFLYYEPDTRIDTTVTLIGMDLHSETFEG